MKNIAQYITAIFAIFLLANCTDVIDVETDPAENQLVIDGWINDQNETQTIRLTQSQAYFDNTLAVGVEDATVSVETDEGKKFEFTHSGNGDYIWTPSEDGEIGPVGTSYTLNIEWDSETYTAETIQYGSPEIDSITQEFREDELGGPDGIYAQFFARDLPGLGNTYWVKAYKNGVFLNKPSEMNLVYDAAFAAGGEVDGLIFIPPIREAINRIPDEDGDDDGDVPPWAVGDEVRVEIHSISNFAHDFLTLAQEQMTNGDNTIFAVPIANTTGNVINMETGERALGFFNVAKVTSMTEVIE